MANRNLTPPDDLNQFLLYTLDHAVQLLGRYREHPEAAPAARVLLQTARAKLETAMSAGVRRGR